MKNSVFAITLGLTLSGTAFAECPSNLNADQLVECITVEGSGANYQSWQKKFDKLADSTSPITGKKIADIKPAAGKMEE